MPVRTALLPLIFSVVVAVLRADETLYRYEANVMPADPEAGWLVFNPWIVGGLW